MHRGNIHNLLLIQRKLESNDTGSSSSYDRHVHIKQYSSFFRDRIVLLKLMQLKAPHYQSDLLVLFCQLLLVKNEIPTKAATETNASGKQRSKK